MTYNVQSLRELKKLARAFTKEIVRSRMKRRGALVIGLVGDLGAGKTTFTQAFLRVLGIRGRITSPTFILIKKYKVAKSYKLKAKSFIFHIDAYRIKKPNELLHLGLKEILNDPENIAIIEWADRVKKILPKNTLWLYFTHGAKENQRIIKFSKI